MALPLLRPGSTCWRIARARRVGLLVDNEEYFSAALAALERAKRSVLILGWEFDPRTGLSHAGPGSRPSRSIGEVLRKLAAERPHVGIRVLVWDMALPISATRALYPQRAHNWFDGRVHFVLDDRHPPGAAHHQKLLVIDDALAFCSGGDFATDRWDSFAHLDPDPRRRLPSGKAYPPRHDVTMAVDADAAAALGELARACWERATGVRIAPCQATGEDPWPEAMPFQLVDCPIGISRTRPAYGGEPASRESETLHLAAIAAAERLIYLENQYFTSSLIGEALEARLAEHHGPEIVAVLAGRSPSYFDRLTMDAPREALIGRLGAADRYGRFRAFTPVTASGRGIIVHSKAMIVDDRLLRVGSVNLNNRSLGFDTECELAVDASVAPAESSERIRRAIEGFLHRLVGHYVGADSKALEDAIRRGGSLAAAIEALHRPGANRLEPLRGQRTRLLRSIIAEFHLGDPQSPADVFRPWRRRAGPARAARRPLALLAACGLGIAGVAWWARRWATRRD
jgi:phosphatidylserine/phosphatidylglycerophosphate/cardiolipin synthase-like enzyme